MRRSGTTLCSAHGIRSDVARSRQRVGLLALLIWTLGTLGGAQEADAGTVPVFDRSGIDVSRAFRAALRYNKSTELVVPGPLRPELRQFIFDDQTAKLLRAYHVILIPGGEFDAASELYRYCTEGSLPVELEGFFVRNPTTKRDVETFLEQYICSEPDALGALYDALLGTFRTYEAELAAWGIPAMRTFYFDAEGPTRIGDRIGKLNLIARTIDQLDNGTRRFILIGHSFGGLNICDFLVELLGGHRPGMPEWKFFANTDVRSWSIQKKKSLFGRIAAAVFLNSFLQGNLSNERRLEKRTSDEGMEDPDPVGVFIQQVIERACRDDVDTKSYIADEITHLALITARYRTGYYLTGRNTCEESPTQAVTDALSMIARHIPLISICCKVPLVAPYARVGINVLVYKSKEKWKEEYRANDGVVNTYGGIFPRPEALYAVFDEMDHGTLVMRPDLRLVTSGSTYDQISFIRTLLAAIASRLQQ